MKNNPERYVPEEQLSDSPVRVRGPEQGSKCIRVSLMLAIVLVMAAGLALVFWPVSATSSRDARRAEGEQLLGSAMLAYRIAYAQDRNHAEGKAALLSRIAEGELTGQWYTVEPQVRIEPDKRVRLFVIPVQGDGGTGNITFDVESGSSEISWQ